MHHCVKELTNLWQHTKREREGQQGVWQKNCNNFKCLELKCETRAVSLWNRFDKLRTGNTQKQSLNRCMCVAPILQQNKCKKFDKLHMAKRRNQNIVKKRKLQKKWIRNIKCEKGRCPFLANAHTHTCIHS